jgi:hypothetical protein
MSSAGQLLGGVVGAVIGFYAGGPSGALYGAQIGMIAGGIADPPTLPTIYGPRLDDRKVQNSSYGQSIPIVYGGAVRLAGNVIWSADIQEHKVVTNSGGKGGGPSQDTESYYYTVSCAIGLCGNEIHGIRRIWANGKLIYDVSIDNIGPVVEYDGTYNAITATVVSTVNAASLHLTYYTGTMTQPPDPVIESYLGAGNVPAYRGRAYVVFQDFDLTDYGNTLPNFTFEVVALGSTGDYLTTYDTPTDMGNYLARNNFMNEVWLQTRDAVNPVLRKDVSGTDIARVGYQLDYPQYPFFTDFRDSQFAMHDERRSVFVWNQTYWQRIDMATGQVYWTRPSPRSNTAYAGIVNVFADPYQPYVYVAEGINGGYISKFDIELAYKYDFNWNSDIFGIVGEWPYPLGGGFDSIHNMRPGRNQVAFAPNKDPNVISNMFLLSDYGGSAPDKYALGSIFLWNDLRGRWEEYWADYTGTTPPYFRNDKCYRASLVYDRNRHVLWSVFTPDLTDLANKPWRLQEVDISGFWASITREIALPFAPDDIFYDPDRDVMWVWKSAAPSQIVGIRLQDGSTYKTLSCSSCVDVVAFPGAGYLFALDYVAALGRQVLRRWALDRMDPTAADLSDVVGDINLRAGLTPGEIDVSRLAGIPVDGFFLTTQTAARSGIEPLRTAYFFDATETGQTIKYVPRGGASVATITEDDLAAREYGSELPDVLTLTRAQEWDLPKAVHVTYASRNQDYQVGEQSATRTTVATQQQVKIELPMVLSDDKAKQTVETLMSNAWTGRTLGKFITTHKYAGIEPTDVVVVNGYLVRITKKSEQGSLIFWECVTEDASVYTQTAAGVSSPVTPQTIDTLSPTALFIIDTPALIDSQNSSGIYLAGSGYPGFTTWNGALVKRSPDGGSSYLDLAALSGDVVWGAATNAMPDWHGGNVFDESSLLNVRLVNDGMLETLSKTNVLNGGNAVAIRSGSDGWELAQYTSAFQEVDGSWTLTGWLRGRRGTEHMTAGHSSGDLVVFLNMSAVVKAALDVSDNGVERLYRATSLGSTSPGSPFVFTYAANVLRPYAPSLVAGTLQPNGDFALTFVRRTRSGGAWMDYVDASMVEATEAYEVDILRLDGTVARTISGLTSPAATYSAANQATDFTAPDWLQIATLDGSTSYASTYATVTKVSSLLKDGDDIYAGLSATSGSAAAVWRFRGQTWEMVGGDGRNGSWAAETYRRVNCLLAFRGKVYAGIGSSGSTTAELWAFDGNSWAKIGGDGVNSSWNDAGKIDVLCLAVLNDQLVAGVGGSAGDAEVWALGDNWYKIGGDGLGGSWNTNYEQVSSLCVHGGLLYAGLGSSTGDGEVWRRNADGTWTQVGGDSLNSGWTTGYEVVTGLASDGSNLYAGLGSDSGDGECWSWNGSAWTKIGGDGVNSSWTSANVLLAICGGALVAATYGGTTDGVWRWGGASWTKVGGGGTYGGWTVNTSVYAIFADARTLLAGQVTDTWMVSNPVSAVPNPLRYNAYQLSATVGRGFAGAGKVEW